ncbi:MAG: DEAD/DEAH box helicase [Chitinophagales bacterium]
MSFLKLGLSKELAKQVSKQNYKKPTPVQNEAIPNILLGIDLLAVAKTGSGKTAAFVLPLLQLLEKPKKKKTRFIRSLILSPTRELAEQLKGVIEQFTDNLAYKINTMAVYGGVSINPQMQKLSNVDILVATPGRLLDLLEQNAVHLSETEVLILDEADKMLNKAFEEEMGKILSFLPKKRQNLLFSATFSEKIEKISSTILSKPTVVRIKEEENNIDLITQKAYLVKAENKGPFLRKLINENDFKQILIFVSSTRTADNLVQKLNKNGISSHAIHSKKSQAARTEALRRFKQGNINVLVATDLLARGIDIDFLPCVINYELPRSPKDYVHRIGRTGRAENAGKAISLITKDDAHHFKIIQKKMKKQVETVKVE